MERLEQPSCSRLRNEMARQAVEDRRLGGRCSIDRTDGCFLPARTDEDATLA
jgi:hypothetical protein